MSDAYELIMVGGGAAGLSAAVGYVEVKRAEGGVPSVAIVETAPREQRGGATR